MTRPMMSSATSFWNFVNTSYRLGVMLRNLGHVYGIFWVFWIFSEIFGSGAPLRLLFLKFFWPMTRPMMSSTTSFWNFVDTSYRLGAMLRNL